MPTRSQRFTKTVNYIRYVESLLPSNTHGASDNFAAQLNSLPDAQKSILNEKLKRGNYNESKPALTAGKAKKAEKNFFRTWEKDLRNKHRALVLIYTLRSPYLATNFQSAADVAANIVNGIRNIDDAARPAYAAGDTYDQTREKGGELWNRLTQEIIDVDYTARMAAAKAESS